MTILDTNLHIYEQLSYRHQLNISYIYCLSLKIYYIKIFTKTKKAGTENLELWKQHYPLNLSPQHCYETSLLSKYLYLLSREVSNRER